MPDNYTAIATNAEATAATFNAPLDELDNAIEAIRDGSETLDSPDITSFTNAQHNHEAEGGGGKLTSTAISSSGASNGDVLAADGSGGAGWRSSSQLAVPTGMMMPFAGASAPSGWLFCTGAAVSRTTYSALFNVIGTVFGTGDGSTTFNLPDMRGRVGVGRDDMGGTSADRITASWADSTGGTGGSESVTLTTDQMPSHQHMIRFDSGSGHRENTFGSSGDQNASGTAGYQPNALLPEGGGQAHTNLQPGIALNWCIKA